MAAALKGLGLQPPRSLNCESPKNQSETRPQSTDPHLSDPSSIQSSPRLRKKRKSDEDLPVPPQPPPNLPPSATPLKSTSNKSLRSKARPPQQSLAFNCLTCNGLVSSSPFKVGTFKMSKTVASSQSDSGAPNFLTSLHSDKGKNSSNESDLAPGIHNKDSQSNPSSRRVCMLRILFFRLATLVQPDIQVPKIQTLPTWAQTALMVGIESVVSQLVSLKTIRSPARATDLNQNNTQEDSNSAYGSHLISASSL
ncbi:hypothetical protein BY996DRAFT_6418122 [Phakopsora pachyrhizi]|nr:hypothetical protein BY996DRAFT_6418122 [Phakopsora pachyrhizi]